VGLVQDHLHERVDLGHRVPGRLGLGLADVRLTVDDLTLEVRLVDDVEVDHAERADTRRREVEQGRTAQATRADDQDLRVLQPLLPVDPDVRDDQVAAVARYFFLGQLRCGLHERRKRHLSPPRRNMSCTDGQHQPARPSSPMGSRPKARDGPYCGATGKGLGVHTRPLASTA
jgi:hypothetical protein